MTPSTWETSLSARPDNYFRSFSTRVLPTSGSPMPRLIRARTSTNSTPLPPRHTRVMAGRGRFGTRPDPPRDSSDRTPSGYAMMNDFEIRPPQSHPSSRTRPSMGFSDSLSSHSQWTT
ncbi:hypothetical protein PMAYCL1PPCAC_15094 [Pristionchus mayeri]|uniref:Uncharacterized protein n=1 Tax=Pristionchus mayeri TaxID=1317129 RepID=A0AAN5CIB0_9BILA|nr:hypothetical protein PMAYCL1PPCAC_15094 [Pristionchus mayeri]